MSKTAEKPNFTKPAAKTDKLAKPVTKTSEKPNDKPARVAKPTLEDVIAAIKQQGGNVDVEQLAAQVAKIVARPKSERTTKTRTLFLGIRCGKYKSTGVKFEGTIDEIRAEMQAEQAEEPELTLTWQGVLYVVDRNAVLSTEPFKFPDAPAPESTNDDASNGVESNSDAPATA